MPAFQLHEFTVNVALKDEFDKDSHPATHPSGFHNKTSKHAITVAMKSLDSKPTTTKVCLREEGTPTLILYVQLILLILLF